MTSPFPDSAISSWGGFAYQGKVALHHSLCLLCEKEFEGKILETFHLQLDSTDDFAIYDQDTAISIHQVKAKASRYRSIFKGALDKSSKIETDCEGHTKRYFHVANQIDDDSDYINPAGASVEFYSYGAQKYCALDRIEEISKDKIEQYLTKNSLICTDNLKDKIYCHLSELITSKVIKIHAAIHILGISQNQAAYTLTICSDDLEKIVRTNFIEIDDVAYQLIKLRMHFTKIFENYVADNSDNFSKNQVKEFEEIYRFVYSMNEKDLTSVLSSLRPGHKNEPMREDDIRFYTDIVIEITRKIMLKGIPHYLKVIQRYLPTAIKMSDRFAPKYKEQLLKEIRDNPSLANILYEYNVLITSDPHANIELKGEIHKVTPTLPSDKITANIIKEFPVSIISMDVAKKELNA